MTRRTLSVAAILAMAATPLALAQDTEEAGLTIGDKAPKFDIAHWVKGEQIDGFESGKVYVMEFWATWCGPCVASMPHISELQERYRDYDVTFIGVSDEDLQTVVSFLFKEYKKDNKIHNDRIAYTLTTDPDMSVKKDYFQAAGQRGIPCAFIVGKDQHIEWIGHPMNIDEPLDNVVKDSWDRDEFKTKWEKAQKAERAEQGTYEKMQTALRDGDHDTVLAMLDEMIEGAPEGGKWRLQVRKFWTLLAEMDKPKDAYAYGDTLLEEHWDNSQFLNQIAWMTVDEEGPKTRDLDFCMKAAKRANELTDGESAAILDTVARVYFEKGDLKSALDTQRQAVEALGDSEEDQMLGDQIREVLERYEEAAKSGV